MNPRNGLVLNPLYDKVFEQGFVVITADYRMVVSSTLEKEDPLDNLLWKYLGMAIRMPRRFLPDPNLLSLHYKEPFRK